MPPQQQEPIFPDADPAQRTYRGVAVVVLAILLCAAIFFAWALSQDQNPGDNSPAPIATGTTTSDVFPLAPLRAVQLILASGKNISLKVPQNYSIDVAAEGFHRLRFMAWSPDHRLFVGEMTSASDTTTGRVVVFDDFDSATGRFQSSHIYLDNLRNPNSVAFYTDPEGREWLYVALTDKLVRYPYRRGSLAPSSQPEMLSTFPGSGRELMAGGWHITRTLAFNGNQLFVSVGSSCNSCEETEADRAAILSMGADGSNKRVYASGLRNAVGITFVDGALYATANEVDHLGPDRPNDVFYKIEDGTNYGWPRCYEYKGAVYADDATPWQHPSDCSQVPLAFTELEPHSAPLGLEYFDFTFADPALRDSFLIAEHGSGKPSIGTGNVVSLVRKGTWTPFLDGFLQGGERQGRAVDILRDGDRAFFVTDDLNGAIYYLKFAQS